MQQFKLTIEQKLAQFMPYLDKEIELEGDYFRQITGPVSAFVQEIEQTMTNILQQNDALYTEHYAHQLVNQFNELTRAIQKLQAESMPSEKFEFTYQFPKNVHQLPVKRRLVEYQKALELLNQKIGWLIEQAQKAKDPQQKRYYQAQIEETEFRKMKCVNAIAELR